MEQRSRKISEVIKRSYADEEVQHLYEFGRFMLECGDLRKAEAVFLGLVEVAPDYFPAWLGMAYVCISNRDWDGAIRCSRSALRIDSKSPEVLLYLIAALLTVGDYNAAGAHLGEVGDLIEAGAVTDPNVIRFHKAQLARYQNRPS